MDRRLFLRGIVALAAVPIVAKLPLIERVGAWAECRIIAGQVTSVTITNGGSGYNSPIVSIG